MKDKKQNSKNRSNLWLIAGAIILLSGIAWFSLRPSEEPVETSRSSQQQLSSLKIPTLPPEMFTGKARDAYQVAKEIPEVLNQVQCYCGCKESDGHQSNFFCFTDQHGAGWTMCQDIALDARKMHKDGLSIENIRENIRAKYGRYSQ